MHLVQPTGASPAHRDVVLSSARLGLGGHWIVVTSHARINRVSMTTRPDDRRAFLQLLLASCALPLRGFARQDKPPIGNGVSLDARTSSYHVHPQGRIQDALEAAARDPVNKTVYVHAGTYRPAARGQALVWFNARHDGITLEAVGDVTLTASQSGDRRQPRAKLSRRREPRRLFRRRRVAKDRPSRLQNHRRQELHDRLRRQVAD